AGYRRAARRLRRREAKLACKLGLRHYCRRLLSELLRIEDHGLQANRRVRLVGLVDDLLEFVVGDDVQSVNSSHASAPAVGETQAATDGLFDENTRVGRA